jgi:hypothetical protein
MGTDFTDECGWKAIVELTVRTLEADCRRLRLIDDE